MRVWITTLLLLLNLSPVLAAGEPGWTRLTGKRLHTAFTDMEVGDGVHFAYRFHADNSADGVEMGRFLAGKWRIMGNELCWQWTKSRDDEECYEIERKNDDVRAYRYGVEIWSGTLKPLHLNDSR